MPLASIHFRRAGLFAPLALASLAGILSAAAPSSPATGQAGVVLDLQPVVSSTVSEMRVIERLPADFSKPGEPLTLAFDTLAPVYERTSDKVEGLIVEDALGRVPMAGPVRDGDEDLWRANRPTQGPVTIRYSVPAASNAVPHSGPITYLQTTAGGLSGAFSSFLLAPRNAGRTNIAVRWQMPAGQRAITTASVDDFDQTTTLSQLANTLFVAGSLVQSPENPSNDTLVIAGLAQPKSEVEQAALWFRPALAAMGEAFGAGKDNGYRVMFFSHDRQGFSSGTSKKGGFLFFLPSNQRLSSPKQRSIIAHEMVHSFVNFYGGDTGDWYNEGIADYAALIVPQAAGLVTPQEYLRLVNEEAAFYYLNRFRDTPNDKIADIPPKAIGGWSVPYTRGAMYFANLDAKLRARHSKVTVLDLVKRMNPLGTQGPIASEEWSKLLMTHAGTWAVADWRDMMAGKLIRPVPGAFGECLVARPITAGQLDLGASGTSFRKGNRIGHVDPASNAFKAGLRSSDVFRETFEPNDAGLSFDERVTFKVARDGKPMDVTFAPRSGRAIAYKWFPRSGNAARPCR